MKTKRLQIIIAFAAVYLIWGSTYLAIRFAIETLPTFIMAGVRFVVAGLVLYGYCLYRGNHEKPTMRQWINASIVGGLLLLGGNGSVVWAEHFVPSGLTAVLIATVPWWMVIIEWVFYHGPKPQGWTLVGLCLGLVGVGVLIFPAIHGQLHLVGTIVVMMAAFWWAIGSVYARHFDLPASSILATAMEMITGGMILLLFSLIQGEWGHVSFSYMSFKSIMAFLYLIVFGSFFGFTAYIWLIQNVGTALASTYAFVNPVVAVFLGCVLAGEKITVQTCFAAAMIILAVILITFGQKSKNIRSKVQISS
ncbi:MAG: drug/metabolite exporter YedA [Candidatus Omnitrophota bacterium]